ncbi:MAG: tetratricopeptide repeat protein [Ignavibacteriaceae bacterium]|nr:tetratricopeptide repeat protein [Ignavibacteriaceae bacterium]
MQSSKIIVIAALFLGIIFTGFQCSSTELTSAKLYIQQKNYDKALEVLKKEVEKNPQSDEGYYLMGGIYGERGQYDQMVDSYNKSLAISKKFEKDINNQKVHYWYTLTQSGAAYFKRVSSNKNQDSIKINLNKAATAFENAVMVIPDSAYTYYLLSLVYMSQQNYDKAIKPLEKYTELGKSSDGYVYLGSIYYDKGNRLKESYTKSKNVQDSIGYMEDFNKAITVLEEGRAKFPNDTKLLSTLSSAYVASNRLSVAIDAFKSLAESDPKKENLYNYGVVLLGAEKYEDAIKQFNKALEIDPNYQNAIYNIAVSYVKWGTEINKEAEDKGDKGDSYKDKYRQAIPYLEHYTQIDSQDIKVWDLLGKVYAIVGMPDKAKDAYDKVDQLRKSK